MIRVSEIFGPTVQGEGPLIGKPTVFVRTGGCDYRCTWCDTLYAVLPEHAGNWTRMEAADIMARVNALSGGVPLVVSLSGGNPAMHDLEPLIYLGHATGYEFSLETQGSLPRDWFAKLDYLFLSPKPPSSGESVNWGKFEACLTDGPAMSIKVTVFDEADYTFAQDVAARYPTFSFYLQVGNPAYPDEKLSGAALQTELMRRYRWLVDKVAADKWYAPTVLPQLHVLAWGTDRGH